MADALAGFLLAWRGIARGGVGGGSLSRRQRFAAVPPTIARGRKGHSHTKNRLRGCAGAVYTDHGNTSGSTLRGVSERDACDIRRSARPLVRRRSFLRQLQTWSIWRILSRPDRHVTGRLCVELARAFNPSPVPCPHPRGHRKQSHAGNGRHEYGEFPGSEGDRSDRDHEAQYRPEQFPLRAAGQHADLPGEHGGGQAVCCRPQPWVGELPSLDDRLVDLCPVQVAQLVLVIQPAVDPVEFRDGAALGLPGWLETAAPQPYRDGDADSDHHQHHPSPRHGCCSTGVTGGWQRCLAHAIPAGAGPAAAASFRFATAR